MPESTVKQPRDVPLPACRPTGADNVVRRRTVTSGGVPLAVFERGDPASPVILLVHGYPDTHRVWDRVCDTLSADYLVVRYDVRGAGLSGVPEELRSYRLEQLADDLFAVMDSVSPDRPVHLAAHDWGSIQAWQAVTDARADGRIASYTTLSGPCLDHVAYWIRHRLAHPTPRHLAQLVNQQVRSWYIGVFHVPLLAPAVWRLGLARNWEGVLRRAEGVTSWPGHPQPTLADDAVRGISLYRTNMRRRMRHPERRFAQVPVQLITLTKDRFVSPALSEDLDQWVPRLWRRSIPAGHWSALTEKGTTVARMIREFAERVDAGLAEDAEGERAEQS